MDLCPKFLLNDSKNVDVNFESQSDTMLTSMKLPKLNNVGLLQLISPDYLLNYLGNGLTW